MYKRLSLRSLSLFLVLLALSVSPAYAAQPYTGAYFNRPKSTTDAVIINIGFISTDGADLTGDHWLGGVLSVAGGDGSSPTGSIFQNGVYLNSTDSVYWACEYYSGVSGQKIGDDEYVGEDTYPFFFTRLDMYSNQDLVRYRVYIYTSDWSVDHDVCTIKTRWADISALDDDTFLHGRETDDNVKYMYYQAGEESNVNITECNWKIRNGHISAKISGSWQHKRGKSIRGTEAVITRIGDTPYGIGGNTSNCDKYSSGTAYVTWKKDNTPIESHTSLWTNEGETLQTVETPFN